MNIPITNQEFILFRDFIERQTGIHLGLDKAYLVEHRLARLLEQTGCSTYGDLFDLTRREYGCGKFCGQIIDAITTNETSWFRDPKQFQALSEFVLPELWTKVRAGRRANIHIWSAACSTGQEPYSIAMSTLDFCQRVAREPSCLEHIQLLATDISESALETALKGRYDAAAMKRGLENGHINRFFHPEGADWVIDKPIRRLVKFKQFNLRHPLSSLGSFDLIFLRNVVIYFSDQFKKELFERMADRLQPRGLLFLGTGETISGYSEAFEVEERCGAVYYRLK